MHKMLEEPTAAAGSGASKVCMAVVISSDLMQWCEVCGLPWSLRAVSIRVFLFSQARGTGCAWQLPPPLPPTTVPWLSHEHSGFLAIPPCCECSH